MVNVSDESFRENNNIHIVLNSYFSCNRSRYETVEKCNRAREATDSGNIIGRMRFACWITKAKNKYSEYVMLTAFHSNSVYMNASCYTHISCLVFSVFAVFGPWQKIILFVLQSEH
jgi:hypothetical protein